MESLDYKLIYVDPYLLLVASSGKIVRLYCPFSVRVVNPVNKLKKDQEVVVDMVKSNPDGWLVYVIQDKGYWYGNFLIIL